MEAANTVIGQNMTIEGSLFKGEGTVRIDGNYLGELDINGTIIIGEKGFVKGNIKTAKLYISGKAEGDIFATQDVHFAPTANVKGNVQTPSFVVDEGARFSGNCEMDSRNTEKLVKLLESDLQTS